ncbi:uncharacterized protein LOC114280367 [Camellia sinensis]|uniref:uncharacterized protein LOC114280367 n=1 Tax=Camellia sinensis TaxID=4442 RepID=UPI001036B9D4|nr:uncharacterized protein LOC114280367 [Camellia sinensis]
MHIKAVEEEVNKLLEAKAIREVNYPTWLSNIVIMKKKHDKWKVCVYFTSLNKACPKDNFPLPKIDQSVDATSAHARMNFLDAYKNYHHIAMYVPDDEKTAFITPKGLYCYRVMPFELKNARATDFLWTEECEFALTDLKKYLTTAQVLSNPIPGKELFLYLAILERAVSAVVIREEKGEENTVYYVSKTLASAETRYLPLKKLTLALVMAFKKLNHYFQAYKIVVLTEYPLKSLLQQGDLTDKVAR